MSLDPQRLLDLRIASRQVSYTDRDVILYALSAGAGALSGSEDLHLVYEDKLVALPTFAQIFGYDNSWLGTVGVDLRHVVHGALDMSFYRVMAPKGTVEVASRIAGLTDKGEGKGGLILQESVVSQEGHKVSTILSTLFVRGGGGFGGSVGTTVTGTPAPDGAATIELEIKTQSNQALLYRLLGDRNALHADPAVAKASGFDAPILHGACTFGIACEAIVRTFCDFDPSRLSRLAARFAGPLYPGETLVFSFWRHQEQVLYRATAKERGTPVLDNGFATLRY